MPSLLSRIFGTLFDRPRPTRAPLAVPPIKGRTIARDALGEYYVPQSKYSSPEVLDDPSTWEFPPQVVSSSNLSTVAFDPVNNRLEVAFTNGSAYVYDNVPKSIYDGLMGAASKGGFHHDHIKYRYVFHRVR